MIETVPEVRNAGVLAEDSEVHDHVFTGHSTAAIAAGLHSQINEYNRLGIPRAASVLSRDRPRTPTRGTRPKPSGVLESKRGAHAREELASRSRRPNCPGGRNRPARLRARDASCRSKVRRPFFLANGEMLPGYAPPGQLAEVPEDGKDVAARPARISLRFPAASSSRRRLPIVWRRRAPAFFSAITGHFFDRLGVQLS
jgi:hypothetical protein